MKQLLSKFVAVEGVLGAYVLNPENGVFESDMPSQFSEESLNQIGRNLTEFLDLARSDFSDTEEISFFFEKAALRMQDFNDGYRIITLFSPNMDRNVLNKVADTFINEFNQALSPPPKLSVLKSLDGGQGRKAHSQTPQDLSPEDLMNSGTLADPLEMMQSALFKVVGPIAKMVFLDSIEQWMTLDTPCMDNLPMLTNIVLEEIGDARLAKDFKERLPSYCCSTSSDFLAKKRKKGKNDLKVVQSL